MVIERQMIVQIIYEVEEDQWETREKSSERKRKNPRSRSLINNGIGQWGKS